VKFGHESEAAGLTHADSTETGLGCLKLAPKDALG
jgi:hypothetical protein